MTESEEPLSDRPARGTRPANRRSLIVAAAAELFYRKGYAHVSMKDIAEAVAIGPSALYRHFAGKQELLHAVVADALAVVDELLDRLLADPTAEPESRLAAVMLEHRGIGALWHVEARALSDEARTQLRQQLHGIGSRLAEVVRRQRPDIDGDNADFLAWCILAVTTSVSFHGLVLPEDRFVRLLADMTRSTTLVAVPGLRRSPRTRSANGDSWSPSRREAILAVATELFAHNGFANVGVEDIGARVGIAGPSVYNHFATKEEILAVSIARGRELLRSDMHRQLLRADGPRDALDRLVAGYAEFAFESTDSIRLLTSEIEQLSPDERHRTRVDQRQYVAGWVGLLRELRPNRNSVECEVRVRAALNLMNDVASTPHLRVFGNVAAVTTTVVTAVLDVG